MKPIYGVATIVLPGLFFYVGFEELNDPFVGPAIFQEAGRVYFLSNEIAAALLVVGHVGGLWAWSRRR